MKDTLHIYTDGGYNPISDYSYYGFVIYKDNGLIVDILNVKKKKVKGRILFEMKALLMAYDYMLSSNIATKLNAKVVVHTEMFAQLENTNSKFNEVKINFVSLLKKKVSFLYSPAHELDMFNIMIDTLISDNNTRNLIAEFMLIPKNDTFKDNIIIGNIGMDTKGLINMFLINFRIRLKNMSLMPNLKKERVDLIRKVYTEFIIEKVILYKGKKLVY